MKAIVESLQLAGVVIAFGLMAGIVGFAASSSSPDVYVQGMDSMNSNTIWLQGGVFHDRDPGL